MLGVRLAHHSCGTFPGHLQAPVRASSHAARRVVRCLATKREEDKSWGELAADAADIAKAAISKVANSAASALGGLVKKDPELPKPVAPPRGQRAGPQEGLLFPGTGGGLLGRMMGGLLSTAMKGLSEQLAEGARQSQGVYEEAAEQLRACRPLQERFGVVSVGAVLSQSVSQQSINGRVSRSVNLVVPVYGSSGRAAQAHISAVEQGSAPTTMSKLTVKVHMPEGDIIDVEGGGGPGARATAAAGRTIDVDWREVK